MKAVGVVAAIALFVSAGVASGAVADSTPPPLLGAPMLVAAASSAGPCCKKCELPLIKYYSVDLAHGFCGDACMDPKKFSIYKKFEANLTLVDDEHPDCSGQYAPDGTFYTDYDSTVTHGDPFGILAVTLDLYAPTGMPDHSCCSTPLPVVGPLMCLHKPKNMTIRGTGPYCCPASATEEEPCKKEDAAEGIRFTADQHKKLGGIPPYPPCNEHHNSTKGTTCSIPCVSSVPPYSTGCGCVTYQEDGVTMSGCFPLPDICGAHHQVDKILGPHVCEPHQTSNCTCCRASMRRVVAPLHTDTCEDFCLPDNDGKRMPQDVQFPDSETDYGSCVSVGWTRFDHAQSYPGMYELANFTTDVYHNPGNIAAASFLV